MTGLFTILLGHVVLFMSQACNIELNLDEQSQACLSNQSAWDSNSVTIKLSKGKDSQNGMTRKDLIADDTEEDLEDKSVEEQDQHLLSATKENITKILSIVQELKSTLVSKDSSTELSSLRGLIGFICFLVIVVIILLAYVIYKLHVLEENLGCSTKNPTTKWYTSRDTLHSGTIDRRGVSHNLNVPVTDENLSTGSSMNFPASKNQRRPTYTQGTAHIPVPHLLPPPPPPPPPQSVTSISESSRVRSRSLERFCDDDYKEHEVSVSLHDSEDENDYEYIDLEKLRQCREQEREGGTLRKNSSMNNMLSHHTSENSLYEAFQNQGNKTPIPPDLEDLQRILDLKIAKGEKLQEVDPAVQENDDNCQQVEDKGEVDVKNTGMTTTDLLESLEYNNIDL